jgi:arginase
MSLISVPYHLDDQLADLNVALPTGADLTELTVELPEADVWTRLATLYESVAGAVETSVSAGSAPTVVSGDCTVSIGLTAGLQRAGVDPSIVWVDAHGDVQSLETTTSGYLGGMALRILLGYRPELIAERLGLRPPAVDRVLLIDARDLDPAEVDYLAASGLKRSTLDDLSAAALPAGPLMVNFDLDVLDPGVLPGLRYPAEHGPDIPAVLRAASTIFDSGRVAALNIACTWNPGCDDSGGAREHLVAALLAGAPQS